MSEEFCIIDGRDLLPPEPMVRTLDALNELPQGRALTLLLYREPFPLYEVLKAKGYQHHTQLQRDGTYHIRIWRAS